MNAAPVRGCPLINATAEFPAPESAFHSCARERKLLMVRLVITLVTEPAAVNP